MTEDLKQLADRSNAFIRLQAIEAELDFPDSFGVKMLELPRNENFVEYLQKCKESSEFELAMVDEVKGCLESQGKQIDVTRYYKEKYRRVIYLGFLSRLFVSGRLNLVEAYREMREDPVFLDGSVDEFIHQFGTCIQRISTEVFLVEHGTMPQFRPDDEYIDRMIKSAS